MDGSPPHPWEIAEQNEEVVNDDSPHSAEIKKSDDYSHNDYGGSEFSF